MISKSQYKEYCRKAYRIAKEHGFHEDEKSDAHFMCLVICEMCEAVEADRKSQRADVLGFRNDSIHDYEDCYKYFIKGSLEEEFADICIRIFDLAYTKYGEEVDFVEWSANRNESELLFTERAMSFIRWASAEKVDQETLSLLVFYLYRWAESLNIDLDWHIEAKMKYNEMRIYKHGKKY